MDSSFAADLDNLIPHRSITLIETSVVGSINLYARAMGAMAAICIVNKIGRKNSILVSLFFSTTAWIIISYFSFSIEIIYIGRIFSGLACGMRAVILLYVSEIAHENRRGKLLAFCLLSASVGTSITYFIQHFFAPEMVPVCALIMSLYGFIQACFLYETKYWLLMKNRFEEAQRSILWFDDAMTVQDAIKEIEEIQFQQNKAIKDRKSFTICKQWLFVKHFIICVLIFSCRTGSGRLPILIYPHNYLKLFAIPITPEIATIIIGILEFVFSLANLFVADYFPRKSMLQMVCWTMIGCLVVSYFQVTLVEMLGILGEWINLLSILLYIGLVCGFLLSLTTIIVTEVASTVTQVRGIILSTCSCYHHITSGIYSSFFPFVLVSVPVNYVLMFMFTNIVILSLLLTLVPETVGKALHKCDWAEEKEQKKSLLAEGDEENLHE